MKCITFIQTKGGSASKAGLEAAGFAAGIGETVAVVSGELNGDGGLGAVGVSRVLQGPANLDDAQLAKLVSAAADKEGANLIVSAQDHLGKAVAGRVAVRLNLLDEARELHTFAHIEYMWRSCYNLSEGWGIKHCQFDVRQCG